MNLSHFSGILLLTYRNICILDDFDESIFMIHHAFRVPNKIRVRGSLESLGRRRIEAHCLFITASLAARSPGKVAWFRAGQRLVCPVHWRR